MSGTFKVSLKANERIFINGAVLRVDRKTSLEFLNDVDFLMENHILQPEDAVTPIRQLYFVVQVILMAPNNIESAMNLYRGQLSNLLESFSDEGMLRELKAIDVLVHERKFFEAMRNIRGLYELESLIIAAERIKNGVEDDERDLDRIAKAG